jgi:4-alpha-glucanotransferase
MQDVLMLGSEHRMNTPGKMWGNWQWRMTRSMPAEAKMKKFAELTEIYGRARVEKAEDDKNKVDYADSNE